ncbi:MAG: YciI family protein [Ectothiorhodospiraceae bacterium]|nr:YciI family protein [Ectothiorhodospiraceae bacterium]
MKYLCLIYVDEKRLEATPPQELEAVAAACDAHSEELRRSGRLLASERLESVQTATTVRKVDGSVVTTDGPFAETKEQLAGFFLVDARDLNDAIRIAADIPPGRFGCIEVRPVLDSGNT